MYTLKNKMVTMAILVFPNWKNEFHVNVDASYVMLDMVLAHPSEWLIDHPISFSNRKLLTIKKKHTMMKREGSAMVYALYKFRHYLLGRHLKMYKDHPTLKYIVNKSVFGGNICQWLLLFLGFIL